MAWMMRLMTEKELIEYLSAANVRKGKSPLNMKGVKRGKVLTKGQLKDMSAASPDIHTPADVNGM